MYEGIPIVKTNGTQILGSRLQKEKRKILVSEDEVNMNQLRNLERNNIISVKKIKK